MKIYPAIDVFAGQVIRLSQGNFNRKTIYSKTPLEAALEFVAAGAEYLHLVDLEGAKAGQLIQLPLIKSLASQLPLKLQVGGGIRSFDQVQALIEAGIDRVIIGSLAVTDFALSQKIFAAFGSERITLGLDLVIEADNDPRVATHGWQKVAPISAFNLLDRFMSLGLSQVLCTDINLDGMMKGPNFNLYRDIQSRYPTLCLLASGGIHNLADIQQLKTDNIGGAIIGKALYEGSFGLREALQC